MIRQMSRFTCVLMATVLLNGCFSIGSNDGDDTPHYYVIDVDRGAVATQFAKNRVLLLKPVKLTSHFRGQAIVFRVGENEYQTQMPHQFFAEPQEMFTEQIKRWLQKSGLFSQVVLDKNTPADLVLEIAVSALYGDSREQFSPQSVLEMQFFLSNVDQNNNQALFQTGLKAEVDIAETTAPNVVNAWKQGFEQLLVTLEDDLSSYFSKHNP